jgi:hypothetical protein
MKDTYQTIYEDILKKDTYTTENDDEYQQALHLITMKEQAMINILERSVPHSLASSTIEEYHLAQTELLAFYEYRDFKYYFSAGLAVGLTVNQKDHDKFIELTQKIRNSL